MKSFWSRFAGIVTTAAQSFYGAKTFNTSITFTGAATPITRITKTTASITPAAVNANSTSAQTFSIGVGGTGDVVVVNPPSHVDGLCLEYCRQNASGIPQLRWQNVTAGSLTPPAGDYIFLHVRIT